MSAASEGIWFPIANNHHLHNPINDQPADGIQSISNPHETIPDKPGANRKPPIRFPVSNSRYLHNPITDQTPHDVQPNINPQETSSTNQRTSIQSDYWSPIGSHAKANLVDGYTQLVTDRVRSGWSCSLVTFLFSQLPGPRTTVISRMKDEVHRIYSTLLTRVHRKPRTASTDDLPVLIGAMDLPVYKRDKASGPVVLCNGTENSIWRRRSKADGVSWHPDDRLVQADSRYPGFTLQGESNAGSGKPGPAATDQCASPANAEATAPQQYGSFSICLALSGAGFRPSLRWLRSSGRRPSFAGTVLGFGLIGAGDPATVLLADRRSRAELRTLIVEMSRANLLWGAPRIHGELLKLGFDVAQSTVARATCAATRGHRLRAGGRFSAITSTASRRSDLFVLPTIAFQILYCLVIMRHGRRLWVSLGVTANPTAEWISRQVTEAFRGTTRRDISFRIETPRMVQSFCSGSVQWAFSGTIRSHSHRPGKMLTLRDSSGSIRRECLDHFYDRVWRSAPAPDPTRICRLL